MMVGLLLLLTIVVCAFLQIFGLYLGMDWGFHFSSIAALSTLILGLDFARVLKFGKKKR
jgi:hypothetical protein